MNAHILPAFTKAQQQSSANNLCNFVLRLLKFFISEWSVAVVLWISLVKQISQWLIGAPGAFNGLIESFDEI